MRTLTQFVEDPRQCSYLPDERASLEYLFVDELSPAEYQDLLSRGYRRFGRQIFRPACRSCVRCRSLRVLTREFELSASERRVMRKNQHIRAVLQPLYITREHLELHRRYHEFMSGHRDWEAQPTSLQSYWRGYVDGGELYGRQWLYFDGEKLVGVALMDEVADAVSLVYCFYDPDWRASSPGTFSVLTQLLYARDRGLPYAYLGYWVEACQSLAYKSRYVPREELATYPEDGELPVWRRDA